MLRSVLPLLVLVLLMLGASAELARAATDVLSGAPVACCPCDDGDDEHGAGDDCCADDLGACGCAAALVVAASVPTLEAVNLAPSAPTADDSPHPAAWRCRPAAPPPTPPPIG